MGKKSFEDKNSIQFSHSKMATKIIADDDPERYERFSARKEIPGAILMPIQGYENSPLVTLEEAVKSIVHLVTDVERMAYVAKMKAQNNRYDHLLIDESAALILYSMNWEPKEQSFYCILNETLRSQNRSMLKPWFPFLRLILNAHARLPSKPGLCVYRGVKGDFTAAYQQGKIITWWGLTSCTLNLSIIDKFLGSEGPRTWFNIESTTGKEIRQHSIFPREDEVLLPPASQFMVVGHLSQPGGLQIIQLREILSKFPLIYLPILPNRGRTNKHSVQSEKLYLF